MDLDNLPINNFSFLRARDPSILSFNRATELSRIKANLGEAFGEETTTQQQKEEQSNNIRVYLRIKNGCDFQDLYEINGCTITSKIPAGSSFLRNVRDGGSMKKMYTFTKIFEPETTQRDVFNHTVKPKILEFINGENSTLLTYGASGSGKTFTVIGTDEEPGIVPRSLEYLFRTLPQLSKQPMAKPSPTGELTILNNADRKKEKLLCRSLLDRPSSSSLDRSQHLKTYMAMRQRLSIEPVAELDEYSGLSVSVWVSFAEIYNEHIYDLLQLDPPRGQQKPKLRLGMSKSQVYIKNLTSVSVTSGEEAFQILHYGIHNLNYAPTQVNKHSSRSHSIFTIKLVQVSEIDGGSYMSIFNFCDLAGSERSKKTCNVGDRLKESNNINSSLLVLGRCISAVRNVQKQNDQKLVPFRESKLTQLFQKALAGGEDIAMIVNISPSREMFDESQHVLNFSAIAQEITIEHKLETKKKNRFSRLVEAKEEKREEDAHIEDYKNAIQLLHDELENQRSEYEMNQQINMNYLREEYDKILRDIEDATQKRIEKAQNAIKVNYEVKLENMRSRYQRIIEELEQKNTIIEVDSSDDEDELKEKIVGRDEEIRELKETLAEGVSDFRELEARCKFLECENVKLKEKIYELENALDWSRRLESENNSEDDLDVEKTI